MEGADDEDVVADDEDEVADAASHVDDAICSGCRGAGDGLLLLRNVEMTCCSGGDTERAATTQGSLMVVD